MLLQIHLTTWKPFSDHATTVHTTSLHLTCNLSQLYRLLHYIHPHFSLGTFLINNGGCLIVLYILILSVFEKFFFYYSRIKEMTNFFVCKYTFYFYFQVLIYAQCSTTSIASLSFLSYSISLFVIVSRVHCPKGNRFYAIEHEMQRRKRGSFMLYLVFLNISCYIAEILINFLIVTYALLSSFSLEMSPLLSIYLSLFHHYLYLCPSFLIISISVPLSILSLTLSLFPHYLYPFLFQYYLYICPSFLIISIYVSVSSLSRSLSLFHHYLYICPSLNIISISVPLLIISLTLSLFQDYLLFCISLIITSSSAYLSILYLTRLSFNIISNSVYLSSLSPFLAFFFLIISFLLSLSLYLFQYYLQLCLSYIIISSSFFFLYYLYLCIYFNITYLQLCLSFIIISSSFSFSLLSLALHIFQYYLQLCLFSSLSLALSLFLYYLQLFLSFFEKVPAKLLTQSPIRLVDACVCLKQNFSGRRETYLFHPV